MKCPPGERAVIVWSKDRRIQQTVFDDLLCARYQRWKHTHSQPLSLRCLPAGGKMCKYKNSVECIN